MGQFAKAADEMLQDWEGRLSAQENQLHKLIPSSKEEAAMKALERIKQLRDKAYGLGYGMRSVVQHNNIEKTLADLLPEKEEHIPGREVLIDLPALKNASWFEKRMLSKEADLMDAVVDPVTNASQEAYLALKHKTNSKLSDMTQNTSDPKTLPWYYPGMAMSAPGAFINGYRAADSEAEKILKDKLERRVEAVRQQFEKALNDEYSTRKQASTAGELIDGLADGYVKKATGELNSALGMYLALAGLMGAGSYELGKNWTEGHDPRRQKIKAIEELIRQRGAARPLSVYVAPTHLQETNGAYADLADAEDPKIASIKKKVHEDGDDPSLKEIGSNVADSITPLGNKLELLGAGAGAAGLGLGGVYGHLHNITESEGSKRVLQAARSAAGAMGKSDLPRLKGDQRQMLSSALKRDATENYMLGAPQLANEKMLPGISLRDISLTKNRIPHIPRVRKLMEQYPDVASRIFGKKGPSGKHEFDWGRRWEDELDHYNAYTNADKDPLKHFDHVATEAFQNTRMDAANSLESGRMKDLTEHLLSKGLPLEDAQRVAKSTQWRGWGQPPIPEKPSVDVPEHLMKDVGWEDPRVYAKVEGPAKVPEAKNYFKSLLESGADRETALKTTFQKFPETAEHFYRVSGAAALNYAPWIKRVEMLKKMLPPVALGIGGGGLAAAGLGRWLKQRQDSKKHSA